MKVRSTTSVPHASPTLIVQSQLFAVRKGNAFQALSAIMVRNRCLIFATTILNVSLDAAIIPLRNALTLSIVSRIVTQTVIVTLAAVPLGIALPLDSALAKRYKKIIVI